MSGTRIQGGMSEIFEMYQPHTLAQSELKNDGPYLVYGANGVIGKHTSYNHEEAQVLVTCRGATCGAINVSAPFSWINGNAMVIKPRENNVDLAFLKYYLESGIDIKKVITGAAQPQITRQSLSLLKVDLPPLAEQQRIAEILDKAELIKRNRELAIEKLDELAQSVFIEMFGNPDINPKNFKEESLLEFFKFKTGKLDSNAASVDGIYPFFTCAKEDFFIDKYAFDEEALLLAGNNANADYSVKHFKGKFNAYQRTYVINLADSRNSYIYAKDCLEFKLKELKYVSKGSSTKYLTMGIFKKMKLLVPPVELQQEYSSRILNLRLSKEIMLSDLSTCNALHASLRAKFLI